MTVSSISLDYNSNERPSKIPKSNFYNHVSNFTYLFITIYIYKKKKRKETNKQIVRRSTSHFVGVNLKFELYIIDRCFERGTWRCLRMFESLKIRRLIFRCEEIRSGPSYDSIFRFLPLKSRVIINRFFIFPFCFPLLIRPSL